jgi:arsenate reductase (thioredoxin)
MEILVITMKQLRLVLLGSLLLTSWVAVAQQSTKTPSSNAHDNLVVFVCEHGAAQSIVAAAYFNKLATEKNIPYRAIARGTTPQEELSVSAVSGLRADGLTPSERKPAKLSVEEVSRAARVVTFLALPSEYDSGSVEEWTDVPAVSAGYAKARDLIVLHVKQLLEHLPPLK